MAVGFAVPTGDVAIAWSSPASGTHYDDIDEGIAGGSGSDAISATESSGDDGDIDDFSFGTIPYIDEITQVIINVNSWAQPSAGPESSEIDLYFGSAWMSATVGWKEIGSTDTRGWHAITYAGLSGDQDDMDAIRVRVRADCAVKMQSNNIYTINVEVTYSAIATEWGHVFNGVAGANIASVSGVAIANIGSIKGVVV